MKVVPEVGFEPTRPCDQRILSPLRLPLRHSGRCRALCIRLRPRAFSLYTACSLRSVATILFISRVSTTRSRTSSFGDFPRVERNPALTSVLVHSHGGPGASHAAQTVVFTHTGESAEKIQLVFSTISMLVSEPEDGSH